MTTAADRIERKQGSTLAEGSMRAHAIDSLRRQIATGRYTAEDVKRWEAELGPVVGELVAKSAHPTKEPAQPTKKKPAKK